MATISAESIRILLVEDHAVVRAGLRLLLENHARLTIVGEAATTQPDVILLDLDLGRERGIDVLPVLIAAAPQARIMILTGLRDVHEHHQAVAQGAVGLVHKEQAPEVLLRAIEKVHSGEVWLERTMLVSMLNEMMFSKTRNSYPEAPRNAMLTEREREVIALVGEGLKNKQIAQRLSISEITVRHHLTSIFSKLGVESRLEMAIFAHRHGLNQVLIHK
jgi:two-component system, NarL family, nitrate/nitrite response regulator NarL